jgi:L-alanine-DL-glutamate epimerase-like enolase superfamily enzyme
MAHAYGLPVSMMNCPANFMAHLAAAIPNHVGLEVLECGREQCMKYDNRIEDGFIVLGETPGLGIEIDQAALAKLQAMPPTGRGQFPFSRREGAGRYVHPLQPGEVEWPHSGT